MGVVALIRKNTGVLGGAGHYNLCWPEYLAGCFSLFIYLFIYFWLGGGEM